MNDSDDSREEILQGMSEGERDLLLIQEQGIAAKQTMDELVWQYQYFGDRINIVKGLVRFAIIDYNEDHDDESLGQIEQWTEVLDNFIGYRKKLRVDISEAREKVRWLRVEYKKKMQEINSSS